MSDPLSDTFIKLDTVLKAIDEGWVRFLLDKKIDITECSNWCRRNAKGGWVSVTGDLGDRFYFEDKKDATMFALRWS